MLTHSLAWLHTHTQIVRYMCIFLLVHKYTSIHMCICCIMCKHTKASTDVFSSVRDDEGGNRMGSFPWGCSSFFRCHLFIQRCIREPHSRESFPPTITLRINTFRRDKTFKQEGPYFKPGAKQHQDLRKLNCYFKSHVVIVFPSSANVVEIAMALASISAPMGVPVLKYGVVRHITIWRKHRATIMWGHTMLMALWLVYCTLHWKHD